VFPISGRVMHRKEKATLLHPQRWPKAMGGKTQAHGWAVGVVEPISAAAIS